MPSIPDEPRDPARAHPPTHPETTDRGYEYPDPERAASAAPTEADLEEQLPGAEHLGGRDPYAAFRYRDYSLYAVAGFFNTIPGQMQSIAVAWEVYQLTRATGSIRAGAQALGYVALIQALPVILLSLHAGQIADRFERRKIVLIAQIFLVLSSLGLAALSYYHGPITLFYGCLLAAGIAHSYEGPARSAMLRQLVPTEVVSNAITWNSTRWQLSSTIGPALGGGALVVFHGATWVYVINAVGICLNAIFIALIKECIPDHAGEVPTFQTLVAGLHFVWRSKLILATITMDLFAVLLGGAVTLLPIYQRDVLHVPPSGLGWLRAAPGIGAVIMALCLAHLPPMRRAGIALLWAVAGFGVVTIVFGVSRIFWLSMLMLALSGALDNVSVVVRHTLVQVMTPMRMLGRVSAVNNIFIGASNELGGFESGQLAAWFGPTFSVVFGGIGTILTVIAVALIWPEVRHLGSLEDARPDES